jgi:hypothetical protein
LQVATFIVQKILLDDIGLRYICATAERFFAVATVLAQMVQALAEQPSARLLKHIIRGYLRLTENARLVPPSLQNTVCRTVHITCKLAVVLNQFDLIMQGVCCAEQLPPNRAERRYLQLLPPGALQLTFFVN